MIRRNLVRLAVCVLALSGYSRAIAQAPFTIRRPQDGSVVREKVRVEIPRASIREGAFVAFYIDDALDAAIAPDSQETSDGKFTYIWDTKALGIKDGEHRVRAVLYEPAAGVSGIGVAEKARSEVKLTLSNKITDGPSAVALRYKFREGEQLNYSRVSKSLVLGGISSAGQTVGDREFVSVNGQLTIGVMDYRPQDDVALVRNKLTALSILTTSQETTLDASQLSTSMYQEMNSLGRVLYETGGGISLAQLTESGLPVENSLELPLLPAGTITVGATWRMPDQRLDIPGLQPSEQPKVTLENIFEGLEWESNYKVAKIHQFTSEVPLNREILYPTSTSLADSIVVAKPRVAYDRYIYVAYQSGKLIKVVRTLTIKGRTTIDLNPPPVTSGAAGNSGGVLGLPGMGSGRTPGNVPEGMMRGVPGYNPGGRMGRGDQAGSLDMAPPPGYSGRGGLPGQGVPGQPGQGAPQGLPGQPNTGSRFGNANTNLGPGPGLGVPDATADHPVTLRSVTTTYLITKL